MIEKYSNYYEQRSASREKSQKKILENKENASYNIKHVVIDESLGLRDPIQELEKDLSSVVNENDLTNPRFIKQEQSNVSKMDDAAINDILGSMGMKEASPGGGE